MPLFDSLPGSTMRIRWFILLIVFSGVSSAQTIPRTASGKPNLQGIWQVQNRAAYDLQDHVARHNMPAGRGVVDGEIPYLDWALEQKKQNFANRATDDPLSHCYLPGTPRIMYLDYPFHIFQNSDHVAITFEWTQIFRLIYTNGKPPKYPGIVSWMGNSRGNWEGDVLVVEVTDFNDKAWFDAAGNFHSDALHLTERYELLDANTIGYEVTVEDAKVFTRPWTIRMKLHRQLDIDRILEYQCQAEVEEANGKFERDTKTWYPAPMPADNEPFDYDAGVELVVPEAAGEIPRLEDGTPDIGGFFMSDAGGANYGLEAVTREELMPPSRGHIVDPADGRAPYQAWARAESIERYKPHRGYDDPTAHCFPAGVPRSHYVPAPFYILQTPGHVVVLHERMSYRLIPLDGRDHLPDHLRLWQGTP